MKPEFVTFTGLDESTDIERVLDLSARYPVEWGILFSKDRTGKEKRFPALQMVEHLFIRKGLRLSAHICGKYARDIVDGGHAEIGGFLKGFFERVQINVGAVPRNGDLHAADFAIGIKAKHAILQTRDSFPTTDAVDWLFDRSGGRGEVPTYWPVTMSTNPAFCGYAGGIGPENVVEVLEQIIKWKMPGKPYWIDMEGKIRSHDFIDLDKCEAVLKAVYGKFAPTHPSERKEAE